MRQSAHICALYDHLACRLHLLSLGTACCIMHFQGRRLTKARQELTPAFLASHRSIACIVLWALIIIISIVCLFVTVSHALLLCAALLWLTLHPASCRVSQFARPPNVAVSGLTAPSASDVQVDGTTFSLNSTINFAISNPNSFTATIKSVDAHVSKRSDSSRQGRLALRSVLPH